MVDFFSRSLPLWHSLLFVPANNHQFIHKASTRGADAIIIDLEDSVPIQAKPAARAALSAHIDTLHSQSVDIVVRINRDLLNAIADLEVAVVNHVKGIMLPKVMGAEHVRLLDEVISTLEQQRNIEEGSIKLIAMIETIEGLEAAKAIASSSSRLVALALGTEDLSLDGGFEPIPENLFLPAQKIIYAARLANISAYGFPASIADYSDASQFKQWQLQAKAMGFNGALCIHPAQVVLVNDTYDITEEALAQAKKIIAAYDDAIANQRGAVEVEGKMIDAPVAERAKNILQRGLEK
jgi:citrate lyase subunit beta / citryl-CoA lyase